MVLGVERQHERSRGLVGIELEDRAPLPLEQVPRVQVTGGGSKSRVTDNSPSSDPDSTVDGHQCEKTVIMQDNVLNIVCLGAHGYSQAPLEEDREALSDGEVVHHHRQRGI
jgi:hypothetical protein